MVFCFVFCLVVVYSSQKKQSRFSSVEDKKHSIDVIAVWGTVCGGGGGRGGL